VRARAYRTEGAERAGERRPHGISARVACVYIYTYCYMSRGLAHSHTETHSRPTNPEGGCSRGLETKGWSSTLRQRVGGGCCWCWWMIARVPRAPARTPTLVAANAAVAAAAAAAAVVADANSHPRTYGERSQPPCRWWRRRWWRQRCRLRAQEYAKQTNETAGRTVVGSSPSLFPSPLSPIRVSRAR
jgi:hypothetical protein